MKPDMRFRPGDDVRALWLLVLCVLVGGSVYVQTRYQSAIAASYTSTEMLYRGMVANIRIVGESVDLRAVQHRAERDLARVSHDASLSATTAGLLAMLQASATSFHARILEVRPGDTPSQVEKNLQATPVTIRARGEFRDILAFIEDLPHHQTLISISDAAMSVANDGDSRASQPKLDATIHATMYRLTAGAKELRVASAR